MTSVFNNLRLQGMGAPPASPAPRARAARPYVFRGVFRAAGARVGNMVGSLSIGEEIKWASKEGKSRKVKAAEVGKATWSTFGKHGTAVLRVPAASAAKVFE